MNTSIGKRLALLLSGVLLLTGCYAAPAAESVRQGSTPPESVQPTQPPAAETAITTYPVPEENLLVSINMADSPSTGGFWQWDMMLHPYIEAYDPVTRTAYVPCYQSGCRHNDSTCSACSPAGRSGFLQAGSRRTRARNTAARCAAFPLGRPISP